MSQRAFSLSLIKQKINRYILVASIFICFVMGIIPETAEAGTVFENKTFSGSSIFSREQGPYYFKGNTVLSDNVSLTFLPGSTVYIGGQIQGKGSSIVFSGSSSSKVQIIIQESTSTKPAFYVQQSTMVFENVYVETERQLIKAFSSSTVHVKNSYITGSSTTILSTPGSLMSLWNSSVLLVTSAIFKNIYTEKGIEVYNSSMASIDSSDFESVGTQSTISVFDSTQILRGSESTLSLYKCNLVGIRTPTAIESFNYSISTISLSNISEFVSAGIRLYSNAKLFVDTSSLFKNEYGIKSFSSSIEITDSDIFNNKLGGVYAFGGNIQASSNWWGSESGPYHISTNTTGTGNAFIGTGTFYPWNTQKKEACCSSVLFLPGIQGSRLYTPGIFGENQLWEPNNHSDVRKLSMNALGESIQKDVYTRDIIEKTNITFGGAYDITVYKGIVDTLKNFQKNFSIEDFYVFPYDWRYDPYRISNQKSIQENGSGSKIYTDIVKEIERLSLISKTKKVTILAHSYGGLVTKEVLSKMAQEHTLDLIDKVIFVGVPELGSVMSLGSLLHGDNQEIGSGYIVGKSTMRNFAQNVPSVYTTLPKIYTGLIQGVGSSTTIQKDVPSVTDQQSFVSFMKEYSKRPVDTYFKELHVPAPVNQTLFDTYATAPITSSTFQKETFPHIQFFTILAAGLSTPKSLIYKRVGCPVHISHPFVESNNCGLGHEYVDSVLGDGVVLSDDIFEKETSALRWGEKYIVNLAEYNRQKNSQFSHATLMSAPPVISLVSRILNNTIDAPGLPQYITKHGGIRSGSVSTDIDTGMSLQQEIRKTYIEHSDFMTSSLFEYATSVRPYAEISDIQKDVKQIMAVAPNTQVRTVNGNVQYVTEYPTQKMVFIPSVLSTENSINTGFNLKITSVSYSKSPSGIYVPEPSPTVHEFKSIPVDSSSIITYTKTKDVESIEVKNVYQGVSENSSVYTITHATTTYEYIETYPGFETVLQQAKMRIESSGVRKNYKERYIRKIDSMKNKYNMYMKGKSASSSQAQEFMATLSASTSSSVVSTNIKIYTYAKQVQSSLDAITLELEKARSRTYKGGLSIPEAGFLKSVFEYIYKALLYNLSKEAMCACTLP